MDSLRWPPSRRAGVLFATTVALIAFVMFAACEKRTPAEEALEAAAPREYEAWRAAKEATDAAMEAADWDELRQSLHRLLISSTQSRHELEIGLGELVGRASAATACDMADSDNARESASSEERRVHFASVSECMAGLRLSRTAPEAWMAYLVSR